MTRVHLASIFLVAACGGGGGRETASGSGPGTTVPITGSSGGSEGSTDAPTTGGTTSGSTGAPGSSTGGGGPKFDVGEAGSTGMTTGPVDEGCQKVDFLFVIDNSASMEDNQAALVASFPGFIDTIKSTLSATSDYHIMVVDTDDDGRCEQPCVMDSDYAEFCTPQMAYACTANLTACDTTRGAGVVHPVGLYASNKPCPITGGNRYMLPEEPDLAGTFACVAKVGTAGNPSERPMNGLQEAVSAALNGPGGCNEGFLRDDALLVVTFISDDPNYEDMGTPPEWYQSVVDAKKGNVDGIVVAGLIPHPEMGCGNGNPGGSHWQQFIDMWGDHGISGSVCEPDYSPFFAQAVTIIDEACDNFMPPG